MKITITYEKDSSLSDINSYWARTMMGGERVNACGSSWEDARERLLGKVTEQVAIQKGEIQIPPDEEVEV